MNELTHLEKKAVKPQRKYFLIWRLIHLQRYSLILSTRSYHNLFVYCLLVHVSTGNLDGRIQQTMTSPHDEYQQPIQVGSKRLLT